MIVLKMFTKTFPEVRQRLATYKELLETVGGPLAEQGLDSIRDKEFHCLGGSVYALLAEPEDRSAVLDFIVAFQTISDYLDNLCDRCGVKEEGVFRQLHQSMLDALEPGSSEFGDYYGLFPWKEDGGYLNVLVEDCRRALASLPKYESCQKEVKDLTRLYIDLQSFKHMELKPGEELLDELYKRHENYAPNLYWWEFAAACGSTLGVFTLVATRKGVGTQFKAYMPWVNGLHILLDYFIDQEEDREHGDMNLVAYHGSPEKQVERLMWFYNKAAIRVKRLEEGTFHSTIVDGLIGMYLSDPKAWTPELAQSTKNILAQIKLRARMLERVGRMVRRRGML